MGRCCVKLAAVVLVDNLGQHTGYHKISGHAEMTLCSIRQGYLIGDSANFKQSEHARVGVRCSEVKIASAFLFFLRVASHPRVILLLRYQALV